MRLREITDNAINNPESNLITALELLRNRYKDVPSAPKLKTQSLINLVLNTDRTFDYEALVRANEENPAVRNLIKSFNREVLVLQPFGDEEAGEDITNTPDGESTQAPVDTVNSMAKRAAAKRDADIF